MGTEHVLRPHGLLLLFAKDSNALGRHAQLLEQIYGERFRVVLLRDRLLHTAQPGVSFLFADVEVTMNTGDADRAVLFAEQPRATEPAAEEPRKFVSRYVEVGRVHGTNDRGLWRRVHNVVEIVDKFTNALNAAGGIERSIFESEGGR